jgi:transglutaminase-like putative cysteine protease
MDLRPYTCRGFPGEFDRAMADVPVKGIDREQTHGMIRLCAETEPVLYGPDFSPHAITYHKGSRPTLERVAESLRAGPTPCALRSTDAHPYVMRAMEWVAKTVVHPHLCGPTPPDRAMPEEDLIASGRGWCNEQSRVFIALCEVKNIPARMCFLFHSNNKTGHTATEVYLGGKWTMQDVTYRVRVALPDGSFAEARELQGKYRHLAHEAYRAPLRAWYEGRTPEIPPDRGGDLFNAIGICNYLIAGAQPNQG